MCNLPTPAASECTSAAAETSRLYFFRMSLLICLFSQFGVCILLECPCEFANFYMSDKPENHTSIRFWLKKPAVLDHVFRPQQAKYTSTSSEFEFRPYFSGSVEQKWRRSHDIRKFGKENYGPEAAATSAATANFNSTRKQTVIQRESKKQKHQKTLRVRMCARANTLRTDIQDT